MHSTPIPVAADRPRLRVVGTPELRPELNLNDFDAIYRRYSPYVATIGLRILGARDEVEDLVQDVFLVFHNDMSRVKYPERLRGWLATIAVRKAMERLKRRKLRQLFLKGTEHPAYEGLADASASPEQRAEVGRVYRALETMAVADRVSWVLRHVEGCTLDEVVEFTNMSKSTVQRRLKKVEARLQRGQDG